MIENLIGMDKVKKIKAEIERLIKEWRLGCSTEAKYRLEAYKELLSFIDSLEEPVRDDLRNAANGYAFDLDEGDLNTNRDTFIAGAQWQKQQMMKDAIDIIPFDISDGNIHFWIDKIYGVPLEIKAPSKPSKLLDGVEINKKVKLLIIKEE